MINLEFRFPDHDPVMMYDIHPSSQEVPVVIPRGATHVVVWLGTEGETDG